MNPANCTLVLRQQMTTILRQSGIVTSVCTSTGVRACMHSHKQTSCRCRCSAIVLFRHLFVILVVDTVKLFQQRLDLKDAAQSNMTLLEVTHLVQHNDQVPRCDCTKHEVANEHCILARTLQVLDEDRTRHRQAVVGVVEQRRSLGRLDVGQVVAQVRKAKVVQDHCRLQIHILVTHLTVLHVEPHTKQLTRHHRVVKHELLRDRGRFKLVVCHRQSLQGRQVARLTHACQGAGSLGCLLEHVLDLVTSFDAMVLVLKGKLHRRQSILEGGKRTLKVALLQERDAVVVQRERSTVVRLIYNGGHGRCLLTGLFCDDTVREEKEGGQLCEVCKVHFMTRKRS
jgi:hypothetical protein